MMTGMVLATGAHDPGRGWGNLLGLLMGVVGCWAIWRFDKYRQKKMGKGGDDPSPTPPALPAPRETAQVARVSSHPSHAEPDETGDEWYGRIVHRGGRIVRVAKHVVRTGESPREGDEEYDEEWPEPVQAYDPPGDETEFDLPLDDEPEEPEPEPVVTHRESREEYARRCVREGVPKARLVAGLVEHYGLSRAQAYRVAGEATSRPRRPAA